MATREVKLINKKQVHKFQEKLFQCAEEKTTWLTLAFHRCRY